MWNTKRPQTADTLRCLQPFTKVCLIFSVKHSKTIDVFDTRVQTICWDFDTIVKANSEIDRVCDFIRKSKFSPLEALAFIHDYVSTVTAYSPTQENHKWNDKDQFFAGAFLKLPEFVCAGYSSLMKEIIDNLGMPELSCEIFSIEFTHLKKHRTERHARCFVCVNDQKYGVNQTVFDDPTWDNDNDLTHKFTHFAMPNDSLEKARNGLYEYCYPEKIEYAKNKANVEYVDENLCHDNFNHSENQIDQLMIEKVYFNVLQKTFKEMSFEEIYHKLQDMVEKSYDEQELREFKGNLTSKTPLLSPFEAKSLYGYDEEEYDEKE